MRGVSVHHHTVPHCPTASYLIPAERQKQGAFNGSLTTTYERLHESVAVYESVLELMCTHGLLWFHCTHSGLLRLAVSSSLNSSRMGWSKCPATNVWLLRTEIVTTGEFITGCLGSLEREGGELAHIYELSK